MFWSEISLDILFSVYSYRLHNGKNGISLKSHWNSQTNNILSFKSWIFCAFKTSEKRCFDHTKEIRDSGLLFSSQKLDYPLDILLLVAVADLEGSLTSGRRTKVLNFDLFCEVKTSLLRCFNRAKYSRFKTFISSKKLDYPQDRLMTKIVDSN